MARTRKTTQAEPKATPREPTIYEKTSAALARLEGERAEVNDRIRAEYLGIKEHGASVQVFRVARKVHQMPGGEQREWIAQLMRMLVDLRVLAVAPTIAFAQLDIADFVPPPEPAAHGNGNGASHASDVLA